MYSERSNREHLEVHHHGKVMSVSLSGIWSVASETYMSMVALKRDWYRYFEVCYWFNHVGYASLSPESINIITVTWNPFMIFALEAFSFFPLVDATFFPLTLLMRDAMFISCRGRVAAAGKWVNSLCFVYHTVYDFRKFVLFTN